MVTAKGKILWIEGKRADSPDFIAALRKRGYQIDTVASGNEALLRLPEYAPDLVVVQAASLRTSGKRICRSIQKYSQSLPILLINDITLPALSDNCAKEVLTLPFTPRKLISRINPLLPWASDNVLTCGSIQLDLDQRRVRCNDKQSRLTPHLTHLLRLLMEHPGEIQPREQLFRLVWNTEYTGDTRTLDVHISWLRRAIEVDPRKPVHIKTIRGFGYRLDI